MKAIAIDTKKVYEITITYFDGLNMSGDWLADLEPFFAAKYKRPQGWDGYLTTQEEIDDLIEDWALEVMQANFGGQGEHLNRLSQWEADHGCEWHLNIESREADVDELEMIEEA